MIFLYGRDQEQRQRVSNALHFGNLQPLKEYLDQLQSCAATAELFYLEYKEACQNANRACLTAAEHCKHKAREANTKKKTTQAVGGTASAGAIAGGVATGAAIGTGIGLSLLAGVFTMGVGTAIGLGITGATAAIGGTAIGTRAAIATHVIASDFEKTRQQFLKLGANFDEMLKISSETSQKVGVIRGKVEGLVAIIQDVKFNEHSKEQLQQTVTLLSTRFDEYYEVTASCRDELKYKCK